MKNNVFPPINVLTELSIHLKICVPCIIVVIEGKDKKVYRNICQHMN